MSAEQAWRWQDQAASDLEFARVALRESFFAHACFIAQQAGEKSLKALHYAAGARAVIGHSCVALLDRLATSHPGLATHRPAAAVLDQFYVTARYPNGLPAGIPSEVFVRQQAEGAIAGAEAIFAAVGALLPAHP
jgi:HEPN domain-containing protein